jgi:hypothetical protein
VSLLGEAPGVLVGKGRVSFRVKFGPTSGALYLLETLASIVKRLRGRHQQRG